MRRLFLRIPLSVFSLLLFSAYVGAGTLDDYYLRQFGEMQQIQLQKALLSASPEAQGAARCGMPLKHGLRRDWNLLEQTTQKVLGKQLAAPVLAGEATVTSASGHFKVHYTASGNDAPHLNDYTINGVLYHGINYYTGLGLTSAADWASTVAATFENVYSYYGAQGYRLAPTKTTGAPYDIYLLDLAPQGFYGVTNSDQPAPSAASPNAFTSWMELDNDFTDQIFKPSTYSPLQSLQITAAHEYHHAVQYGYTYYFDIWYAEATSTWMEDELYDGVNQLYSYIPAWFDQSRLSLDISESITTGGGYGRWIFNRYLSEMHGPEVIRGAWEKVAGIASSGGSDIPMAPVLDSLLSSTTYGSSLSADFFGFTRRVYNREWLSHAGDVSSIHPYTPFASYSAFPVDANTSPVPAVILPHYSFAYYRFVPSSGAPGGLPITITGTSGIKATVFRKNGSSITEFPFDRVNGVTITVPGFNTSTEVVLLIANPTASDNHRANFSTNGTGLPVTEPTGGTVYPPLLPATPISSGGSSSGCFIATAAYGSYLHPHVQMLRNFRDRHLLTNAPGRAFVSLYYRCSPPLADFIARHPLLRGMTRLLLAPVIGVVAHPAVTAAGLALALLMSRTRRRRCLKRVIG